MFFSFCVNGNIAVYMEVMSRYSDRTKVAILEALSDSMEPVGASRIADDLLKLGLDVQPRTVRFHLLQLDRAGLTRLVSRRRGRVITPQGRRELERSNVIKKVNVVGARVDALSYGMTYGKRGSGGTIVENVSLVERGRLAESVRAIEMVLAKGLGMGTMYRLVRGGFALAGAPVPEGRCGIGTVCSITINGVLLHKGIPVNSRFGGLLEIRDGRPVRFVHLIEYSGSTLDPFEIFIRADMTSVLKAVETGSGVICASFREVPAVAVEDVVKTNRELRKDGLGGILEVGKPNQSLLDIPVSDGYAGIIVAGGLNPIAAVHEKGIDVTLKSLAGLEDVSLFLINDSKSVV